MPYVELSRNRISTFGRAYLVTTVTQGRRPIFHDFTQARLLVVEMQRLQVDGDLESLAYVVMPDHLHWLFVLGPSKDLATVMNILKGRSARALNRMRGERGPVWQAGSHDHGSRRGESLVAAARYLVANPVRAGIVRSVSDYPHWDCVWLRCETD